MLSKCHYKHVSNATFNVMFKFGFIAFNLLIDTTILVESILKPFI
jgi:hypothetical protein